MVNPYSTSVTTWVGPDGFEYAVKKWQVRLLELLNEKQAEFKEITVQNHEYKMLISADIQGDWAALVLDSHPSYGFERKFLQLVNGNIETYNTEVVQVLEVGKKGSKERRYYLLKIKNNKKWEMTEVTKEDIVQAMKSA